MNEVTPALRGPCVVVRARGGDDDALAMLFARHRPLLAAKVRYSLGPKLAACLEVDDILQELFLLARSSPSRRRLGSERGFVAWTLHIARNHIRKTARDWGPKQRPRTGTTLSPLDVRCTDHEELDAHRERSLPRRRVDEEFLLRVRT